ncbi:MAG: ParB/RepB/Spo0J family partition protein [Clostridiales bacterium]|nr:ParB/RepB/Spo0J family partition protein [Clostridiales bacterium]
MAIFGTKKDHKQESDPRILIENIPTGRILPNPDQPRKAFDDESISELAASIQQVGLIQPLIVRKNGENYVLIAGERRLRAVKLLAWPTVQCIISEVSGEEDAALMAIVENLQREDLHFFEEAECYAALLDKLGVTQDELAVRLGKSQSFIANKLRILRLSPEIRSSVTELGLTERHARALLRLNTDSEREAAVSKIAAKSLSVKETEKLVDSMLASSEKTSSGAKPRPKIIRIFRDYKLFINTVNSACDQLRDSGLTVFVEQTDRENGVDITIRISQ